ncbi:MAG: orotidine-5'-phosphate decarboxylase [Bacillota bacterium]
MHFGDKLLERIEKVGSSLVVGIDPDPKRLFGESSVFRRANPTLSRESLLDAFCEAAISAAAEAACAVKPQAAFFEAMGTWGYASLSRCIKLARQKGIPVILDAKRGDIGNTATAYAAAYLDPAGEFFADALTVNPYLGPDTLEPFAAAADKAGSGLFVLVKTSNPGSGAFQDTILADGRPLYLKVADAVSELGRSRLGARRYSNIGAVVGATYPEELAAIREAMPETIFLVPGYGAQGGTAEDVRGAFKADGFGAIVSSSRGIIFAYEKLAADGERLDLQQIAASMLLAARRSRDDIQKVRPSI